VLSALYYPAPVPGPAAWLGIFALIDVAQREFALSAFRMAISALRKLQRTHARHTQNENPATESSHARQC
jgi:hypothetical protein